MISNLFNEEEAAHHHRDNPQDPPDIAKDILEGGAAHEVLATLATLDLVGLGLHGESE